MKLTEMQKKAHNVACKKYRDKNNKKIATIRAYYRVARPLIYGKNLEAQRRRRSLKPTEIPKEKWLIMSSVFNGHTPKSKKKLLHQIGILKEELNRLNAIFFNNVREVKNGKREM